MSSLGSLDNLFTAILQLPPRPSVYKLSGLHSVARCLSLSEPAVLSQVLIGAKKEKKRKKEVCHGVGKSEFLALR